MKKKINIGIYLLSILLVVGGWLFSSIPLLTWGLFTTFAGNLLYASTQIKRDAVFLFFNITFFIFLLGRIFVVFFFGYNPLNTLLGLDFYDSEIIYHILTLLFISLQSLFLGYFVSKHTSISLKPRWNKNLKKVDSYFRNLSPIIRKFSKHILYITFLFRVIQIIDVFLFVRQHGYNAFYISFVPSVPSVVVLIASLFSISFFVYISTMPSKKELIIPVAMYLLEAILSLGTGQRNIFALNILILFIYFIFRLKGEISLFQLPKKVYAIFTVFLLAIGIVFILVGNLRWGIDSSDQGILSKITRLFFDQGVSVNLLGYSMSLDSFIPEGKFYALSPFIRFGKDILSLFTDIPTYNGQTVENALYGDAFTYMITYLIMPFDYIQGRGYGSTYIAELFVDLNYFGVIAGNFVYGCFMNIFTKSFGKNFVVTALSLLCIRHFLFTPRAGYLDFFTYVFSIHNLAFIIGIMGIGYIYHYYRPHEKTI